MIVAAVLLYDEATPFPSLYALLPVGGTVLILLFGPAPTLTGRILATRAFVGIGLISYSAYLWHQPLFALTRIRLLDAPPASLMLALSALSLGLAALSWRYVEQPFRRPAGGPLARRGPMFALSGAAGLVLAAAGGTMVWTGGNAWRYPPAVLTAWEAEARVPGPETPCPRVSFEETRPVLCRLGAQDGAAPKARGAPGAAEAAEAGRRLVVVGDSHARQWAGTLDRIGRETRLRIDLYTKPACTVADMSYHYHRIRRDYRECTIWREAVFARIEADPPDGILLTHSALARARDPGGPEAYVAALGRSLGRLRATGRPVAYLQDNPVFFGFDAVDCLFRHVLNGARARGEEVCTLPREAALDPKLRAAERLLAAADPGLAMYDLSAPFCDDRLCYAGRDGRLMMSDSNHLSGPATALLEPRIRALVAALAGD